MSMGKIGAIFQLLRVQQYYKNVVVIFGIFFANQIFNIGLYPKLLLAFFLTSLISSLNYIQNDLIDIEQDKLHPEKRKTRPLASGQISKTTARLIFTFIALVLIAAMIWLILEDYITFVILLLLIYVNGIIYNFVLKSIPFADVIGISTIYIWRTLAGCAIAEIFISPWLIIVVFLIALFLATGKRTADLRLLGSSEAVKHKSTYDTYSEKLLNSMLVMVATALFVIYTLYCVLGPTDDSSIFISPADSVIDYNGGGLIFSVPVALYIILHYMNLIRTKPEIARNTLKILSDKGFMIGGMLLILIIILSLNFIHQWEILMGLFN